MTDLENFVNQSGRDKLVKDVRKKIDEVVREIQQLENNLGFFSNAKDDNPLVLKVKNSVNVFKDDLIILNKKLSYLKKLDY